MRILILTHTAYVGGAARSLTNVIDKMLEEGYEILIVTPPGSMIKNWEAKGIKIIIRQLPVIYWIGKSLYSTGKVGFSIGYLLLLLKAPYKMYKFMLFTKQLIRNENIDFVYLNSLVLFPVAFPLLYIKRKTGVRIVWHIREVLNSALNIIIKKLIIKSITSVSDTIFAISANEALSFGKSEKIIIVHNILGSKTENLTVLHHNKEETLHVCMAANYYEGKGIPDYIQTYKLIDQHFKQQIKFTLFTNWPVVGDKIDRIIKSAALRFSPFFRLIDRSLFQPNKLVVDNNLIIHFNHNVTYEDLLKFNIYVRCDETASPWGRDIIEAMSAGLVVIATGTSEEFIINGVTGFLVPANNPNLIAEKIKFLHTNIDSFEQMRAATLNRAKYLFDEKIFKRKILSAFSDNSVTTECI